MSNIFLGFTRAKHVIFLELPMVVHFNLKNRDFIVKNQPFHVLNGLLCIGSNNVTFAVIYAAGQAFDLLRVN